MQKIYLLLRDNRESGPHSLEELLQLQLKPHDLIWVEGSSFGWAPPSSIPILQPYLTASQPVALNNDHSPYLPKEEVGTPKESSKIFVSLPRDINRMVTEAPAPIVEENKREPEPEIIRPAAAPVFTAPKPEAAAPPVYGKTLNELKEDYGSWRFQKKKKKNHIHKGFAAGLVLVLLAGIYLAATHFFFTGAKQSTTVQQIKSPGNQRAAASLVQGAEEPEVLSSEIKPGIVPVQETEKKSPPEKNSTKKFSRPSLTENSDVGVVKEEKSEASPPSIPSNEETVTASPEKTGTAEKKKGLGQKISGLFEKRQKDKEAGAVVEEGGNPRTTTTAGGERKAARRGEPAENDQPSAPLTSFLDLRASEKKGDWMMGVVGIKLTLNNKSSEVVKTAAVEVSYFNEENTLLEKKTIYFRNVPARFSQTVAVPDNRLADHAGYKIISAVGKDNDAYVTNK
jgi:hypothetical protein